MRTLKDVPVGESGVVVKIHGEGVLGRRIMDMGIAKSTGIYVHKMAPFGDSIETTVRGYELSLREADTEILGMQ